MMNVNNKNPQSAVSGSSGIVWLLTAGVATIGANSLALGPIAPAIARDLAQGVTDTMLAAGSYGIGTGVGALFLSRYVDALGAARALRIALLVLAAAFALCTVTTGLPGLIAAQGLAGLAAGVALPAIYALAAIVAPPGRESVVLGRVLVGWTISMVAGVSLSAAVADLLHWRAVFAVLAVATFSVWFAIGRVTVSTGRPRPTADTSPLQSIRIPGVPALLIVCFGYMTAFYATYAYIGGHLTAVLQMPVSAGGLVALSYGLGFGVAAFGDHMIDRLGARRVMPYSLLSIAAIYAALGLGADQICDLCRHCICLGRCEPHRSQPDRRKPVGHRPRPARCNSGNVQRGDLFRCGRWSCGVRPCLSVRGLPGRCLWVGRPCRRRSAGHLVAETIPAV